MNSFLMVLAAVSASASVMFGILLLAAGRAGERDVERMYFLMKLALALYLIPAAAAVILLLSKLEVRERIPIDSEDFKYITRIQYTRLDDVYKGDWLVWGLGGVWLLGAAVTYGRIFIRGRKAVGEMNRLSHEAADRELLEIKEKLEQELGIRRKVRLYQLETLGSPFIQGILRPRVTVPVCTLSREEWELALRHELIHLKKGDVLFRTAAALMQSIHWFNPAVIFLKKRLYEFSEYACDQQVIKGLDQDARERYARLLIERMKPEESSVQAMALSDKEFIKMQRRICWIMKKPEKKRGRLFAGTMAACILVCPMATYGATLGVLEAQDHVAEVVRDAVSVEVPGIDTEGEVTEPQMFENAVSLGALKPRGLTTIDRVIGATEIYEFDAVSLSKGGTISVSLNAEDEASSYKVVITGGGKSTTYASSQGGVWGNFTAPSAGTYKINIVGTNGSKGDVHIVGSIRVN